LAICDCVVSHNDDSFSNYERLFVMTVPVGS